MPVMCNVELLRGLIGMAMVTGLVQEHLPFALGLTPFSWGQILRIDLKQNWQEIQKLEKFRMY